MQHNLEVFGRNCLLEVIVRPSVLYFFHLLQFSMAKYSDLGSALNDVTEGSETASPST